MPVTLRTFRLVCDAPDIPRVEALLHGQGFAFEPEPFHPLARRLTHEPFSLGDSLAARFGLIYIQDRSSMLPPLLLAPPPGACVLDMCSAPGSKTGLLSRLVGREGFVLACEPSADRLGILRANLRRTGAVNTATVKSKAQDLPFATGSWEFIQLDPPCSGWGTVDKNPNVMTLWSEDRTGPLVTLQRALLAKAAALLAPGGHLLYSTCTTNEEENEAQVAWAIDSLDLELVPLDPPPGFVFAAPALPGLKGVLRVADDSEGQGFFLARFRKPGAPCATILPDAPTSPLPGTRLDFSRLHGPQALNMAALPPGEVYDFGGKAFFLHAQALARIPRSLRWQGFALGKVAGPMRQELRATDRAARRREERNASRAPKDSGGHFKPDGAARILLPPLESATPDDALNVDGIADLERLVAGQSLPHAPGSGPVGLYYRGLPLAWLPRKGNRVVLSTK
ncbi:RsmB/NOP family class I SAM-dependent RNA methyltransferase [Pseudodesulfovibrio sp. F-1]|uniref:RsmB/NOP family class I SAM-dependent RNA methyltransferase n=1 Tax=Pseudodesulfovibrio alkaliphilus TaxID=2661613 RepID=A0A7K1KPE5_9BACT|nr:RsmB/NOP family class I SAM-dependent RNA methyltransferase [Pseudodesulfovibrio alkaliphilus]MUM77751.1 RsmB/NOP family class I SAM-dependent RNA methyltransferase [Pseudodesulfovibrio alkaliphilus]